MKIAVSYLSSKYNLKETIKKINDTSADFIHMDLMDGKYVNTKNFNKFKINKVLKHSTKELDIHLMTVKPEKYLKIFKNNFLAKNLFFHPSTTKDSTKLIKKIKTINLSPGIVINPDENISEFNDIYPHVDRVLVMSVVPGAGGQKFINNTLSKIEKLLEYKKNNKLFFEIAVDGGINDATIEKLKELKINYIISGSYICQSDNYEEKINSLK